MLTIAISQQHQCLSSPTLHATTAGSKGSNSYTPKRKRSVRGCMLGAPGWNNVVATYYVTMYPGERSGRQCTLGAPGWNNGVTTYPGERFERRRTLNVVVTNNDKEHHVTTYPGERRSERECALGAPGWAGSHSASEPECRADSAGWRCQRPLPESPLHIHTNMQTYKHTHPQGIS